MTASGAAPSPLPSPEIDPNPFLALPYESAFAQLGSEFFDEVAAADFPTHILRFRNNELLPLLTLDPSQVTDRHFIESFGAFHHPHPLLALCYHGYQFGEYNSRLGDGRGFLYGQIRGTDGELYDLGTKGSGTTPYSRGADGRLTLKGGVREVLAAEMLHRLGVRTSRCLSLIETGESLWRGDEPSPTRSSVMVRCSRSHIRFGTFERLHYLGRPDLIQRLLDHVIDYYYPHLIAVSPTPADRYLPFYAELVERVADLTAQWMAVGFCHAVLNTDNMSITGESFDYGPYAFMPQYNPRFTAAYFDYYGRYCYGNQPAACQWNLQAFQVPLKAGGLNPFEMEAALSRFDRHYEARYLQRMLAKLGLELGFDSVSEEVGQELLRRTLQLLWDSQVGYHDFFLALRQQFDRQWREDAQQIFALGLPDRAFPSTSPQPDLRSDAVQTRLEQWRSFYHQVLNSLPLEEIEAITRRLAQHNPSTILIRPEIEAVWEAIATEDDWQPFAALLQRIWTSVIPESMV